MSKDPDLGAGGIGGILLLESRHNFGDFCETRNHQGMSQSDREYTGSDIDNSQNPDIDIITEADMDEAEEASSDADDITEEEMKELENKH